MSAMYHVPGRDDRGGDGVTGVGEQQPSQHGRHVQTHLGHTGVRAVNTRILYKQQEQGSKGSLFERRTWSIVLKIELSVASLLLLPPAITTIQSFSTTILDLS